jgi:hypothetical protein
MGIHSKTTLLALMLAALSPVYGTLVPRLSFEELVGQSEVVAHGRVTSIRVAWDTQRENIWTHYEIVLDEALKGSPGKTVEIQEPGGELDGTRMEIVGAPHYELGEEVVVFAARTPGGLRTCGWGQGRFVVEGEPGQRRVRNDLGNVQLIARGRAESYRAAAAPDEALAVFKQRIREEVRRQSASAGR